MNTERDRFLTEAMGECWHIAEREVIPENGDTPYNLCRCGRKMCLGDFLYNPNFSNWIGFGKLWDWSQKQEWWGYFVHKQYCKKGKQLTVDELLQNLINPDRFADAVYAYLKEK